MSNRQKFRVTIVATYREDESPDPSSLLDSFQDEAGDLLSPLGEELVEHTVTVERLDA